MELRNSPAAVRSLAALPRAVLANGEQKLEDATGVVGADTVSVCCSGHSDADVDRNGSYHGACNRGERDTVLQLRLPASLLFTPQTFDTSALPASLLLSLRAESIAK